MSSKNFVRENVVLIIGLTLPVLLILLFFVSSVLPKSMATPPQYEMLFSVSHYDNQNLSPHIVGFVVRNGMLKARITTNDNKNYSSTTRKLMAYDGKTDSVQEIALDISNIGEMTDSAEVVLDETRGMKLDPSNKAPDGYEFEGPSYRSGGLVVGLFAGGGGGQNYRVKKGAIGYKIPSVSNNYYNDVQFIGWVVEKK